MRVYIYRYQAVHKRWIFYSLAAVPDGSFAGAATSLILGATYDLWKKIAIYEYTSNGT